jgi:hypothetical protein
VHQKCKIRLFYQSTTSAASSQLRTEPGSFQTTLVELSLPVFPFNAKAHAPQLSGVPAADELALAAVFAVDGVAELYEVGVAAHGL